MIYQSTDEAISSERRASLTQDKRKSIKNSGCIGDGLSINFDSNYTFDARK